MDPARAASTEEAEDTEEEEDAAQGSNADEWEEEEDASQSGGGGHTLCFGKAVNSFHATGAGSPFGTYYGCELTIDEVTDMLQAAFPRINRNKFDVTCVLFWCLLRGYRLVINTATQSSSAKRTAVLICALQGIDCQTTPIVCLRLERKGKVQPTLLDA